MSAQPTSIILGPRGSENADESSASDLQRVIAKVITVLCRRRWLFLFPLLTGFGLTLMIGLALPRRYVVNTIFERRDDVVITKLISTNSPYSFETLRRSLYINLMGYHALGQAVDELGLTEDLPRGEDGELTPDGRARKQSLVGRLTKCLEVKMLEKSQFLDLIEVKYKGEDPDLGQKLVAKLTENYITNTQNWIGSILNKSHDFFSTQAQARQAKAAQLEAELLQMAVAHPGVSPSDPDLLSQRLMGENLGIEEQALRRTEVVSKLKDLADYTRELEGQPPADKPAETPSDLLASATAQPMVPNPQRVRLQTEMEQVKGSISDAKALRQMTDRHPYVVGLREKLERIRTECEALPAQIPAAQKAMASVTSLGTVSMDPLAGERKRVKAELKSLNNVLAQIDQDLARRRVKVQQIEEEKGKLFERRQAYLRKEQDVQSAKADLRVWDDLVDKVSRVLAAEESKRGIGFGVVESARRPSHPTSPTLGGIFLLSGGIGLALAVGAVFLREILDRSFRDPARVRQALGIPVLEAIGEIRSSVKTAWFGRRGLLPALAAVEVAMVLALGALTYVSLQQPELYSRLVGETLSRGLLASVINL